MDGNTDDRQEPPEQRQPTSQPQIQKIANPHRFCHQRDLDQPGESVCRCKRRGASGVRESKDVLLVRKASGTDGAESETCYTHTVQYP